MIHLCPVEVAAAIAAIPVLRLAAGRVLRLVRDVKKVVDKRRAEA